MQLRATFAATTRPGVLIPETTTVAASNINAQKVATQNQLMATSAVHGAVYNTMYTLATLFMMAANNRICTTARA